MDDEQRVELMVLGTSFVTLARSVFLKKTKLSLCQCALAVCEKESLMQAESYQGKQ